MYIKLAGVFLCIGAFLCIAVALPQYDMGDTMGQGMGGLPQFNIGGQFSFGFGG
ncbi:hypothetical protein X975_25417, partial [Stegodyphus mimosarum]